MEYLTTFIEQLVNKRVDQLLSKIINKKFDELEKQFEKDKTERPFIALQSALNPEMINSKQAAVYLNKSVITIYGYAKSGKIPYIKEGRSMYFLKKDLDKTTDIKPKRRSAQSNREKRVEDWIGKINTNTQVLPTSNVT